MTLELFSLAQVQLCPQELGQANNPQLPVKAFARGVMSDVRQGRLRDAQRP